MNQLACLIDERENALLAPYATFSRDSLDRQYPESTHPYRGPFQRDRDRVVHCSAFRRLSGKMQVFNGQMGDYHRTRLTHTMEVASIARTIGRALRLNEDLVEALALLHDIGHPPFGHAGEDALDECLHEHGGFSHNRFALTITTELERPYPDYPGLNLTNVILDAQTSRIDKSDRRQLPCLEAQVVDLADSITYDAHDVDDAVKLDLISIDELLELPLIRTCYDRVIDASPELSGQQLRQTLVHELLDHQVDDTLQNSTRQLEHLKSHNATEGRGIELSASLQLQEEKSQLEAFLYDHVYRHPDLVAVRRRAQERLRSMFHHFVATPELMPLPFQTRARKVGVELAVRDYIAGMTDSFCHKQYECLFDEKSPA
ncbi:MAG: dNTP triphosphohydrolase [Planctomycetales bacterium]|nr:dNTP triphosphohydrolase [Planctomycetales bacterium]